MDMTTLLIIVVVAFAGRRWLLWAWTLVLDPNLSRDRTILTRITVISEPVHCVRWQRHLTSAKTYRTLRTAAMSTWREVVAAA